MISQRISFRLGLCCLQLDFHKKRRRFLNRKMKTDKQNDIMESKNINRQDLERILKKGADLIRTRVDYKYLLILLFLKRISDKWEMEYEEAYQKIQEKGEGDEKRFFIDEFFCNGCGLCEHVCKFESIGVK